MNQQKAADLIDQILKSSAGRETLEKKLNAKFDVQPPTVGLPIVAVLVPCYHMPTAEMSNALARMIDASKGKAVVYTGPVYRDGSVVHWVRNMLLAKLIESKRPWTHVLFIDDDIVPPDDAIPRMLAHNKDIVAGVCTVRTDPPKPNIRWWDENELVYRDMFQFSLNTLIEVGAVGTGLIMITRHALEQVADAFFNCKYEIERFELSSEVVARTRELRLANFDSTHNAYWFRFLEGLQGAEYGEDISFCLMASRYCGIQVYADTSIQPKHIGRYGFSLDDFFLQRDEAIAKAKADGTWREPRPIGGMLSPDKTLSS